jgi:hypothetical protein
VASVVLQISHGYTVTDDSFVKLSETANLQFSLATALLVDMPPIRKASLIHAFIRV